MMDIPTDADLLDKIKRFCVERGLKPSTFGRMAIGDGGLVAGMESQRSVTLKTANRIAAFMAGYCDSDGEIHAVNSIDAGGATSAGKSQDRTAPATGVAA